MEAIGNDDVVKPDVLVEEFLAQSSLKVLPKNEFITRLVDYVEKGGQHIMDEFVDESLSKSLKAIVKLKDADPSADIETLIDTVRETEEENYAKNGRSASGPRRRMKDRPEDYDSDLGPHWGDDPSHWYEVTASAPAKKTTSSRNRRSASDEDVEMDDLFVSQADQDDSLVSQRPKPAPKRGAAAKKAPAKKAQAPKKAPATRGRPKKKTGIIVDSDEDEEDDAAEADAMSVDAFMDEDEEADPPAPPPKRATRTTKAAGPKMTTSRATKATPATKTRQSTLNFSQSQRPTRVAQTQKALEVSDDEIDDDDDDDDDAFEPVAPTTRSRRR